MDTFDELGFTTLESTAFIPSRSQPDPTAMEPASAQSTGGPTLNPYPHTRTFDNFWRIHKSAGLSSLPFPKMATFCGTIKLHGANSTIILTPSTDTGSSTPTVTFQSRNLVLSEQRDNKGTVHFLKSKSHDHLLAQVLRIRESQGHSRQFREIMIAGEMCGRGVNNGDRKSVV